MRYARLLAGTFFLGSSLAAPLAAQDYRLNDKLGPGQAVRDFRVTQDGSRVVYLVGDADLTGSAQPYVVDVSGRREPRLLDPRSCRSIEIAGAKRLVFGWIDGTTIGVSSLFLDGPPSPVELGLGTGRPTPDGRWVVIHRAEGLFCVPTDGSAPERQVHPSSPASIHHVWWLTPDSQRVLYITEGSTNQGAGKGHLYSAALDGSSAPVALNASAYPAGIGDVAISPDSHSVVYCRVDVMRGLGLYRARIDEAESSVPLHDPVPFGVDVRMFTSAPLFTADSSRVVSALEQEQFALSELYVAEIDGSSPPRKLSNADFRDVLRHRISPDGARVVYMARQGAYGNLYELLVVPTAGTAPPRVLNGPIYADGGVKAFALGPDGLRVAYLANAERRDRVDLFTVPTIGTPLPRRLNLAEQNCYQDSFDGVVFAQHGDSIVFPATRMGGDPSTKELFTVHALGPGIPRRLSAPMVPGGSVNSLDTFNPLGGFGAGMVRLAADGTIALFKADQALDDVVELWAAPILPGRWLH